MTSAVSAAFSTHYRLVYWHLLGNERRDMHGLLYQVLDLRDRLGIRPDPVDELPFQAGELATWRDELPFQAGDRVIHRFEASKFVAELPKYLCFL